MFTFTHLIWAVISVTVCGVGLTLLLKYKPPLEKVLTVCCIVCIVSELVKLFSVIQMVPSDDGSRMNLYIKMQHLPLHLCSLQIILIHYARFAKESEFKTILLGFMYPTCVAGAFFAILLPSIFNGTVKVEKAFVTPMTYQFFLYHCMLIIFGLYILLSGEVKLKPRHCLTTMGGLGLMAVLSLYTNAMFSSVEYDGGKLVSVDYVPNFFFVLRPPISIKLTEMWQWHVYLAILLVLGLLLITAFYIPVFVKAKREKASRSRHCSAL